MEPKYKNSKPHVKQYIGSETPSSFNLPNGWFFAKLQDLASAQGIFIDGDWVESKDQDANGAVRLIQLSDIGDGWFRNRSNRFLTTDKAKILGCTFLKDSDVLISRLADPLGRACIFPKLQQPCVTVVDVAIFRGGTESVNHQWLVFWINSPEYRAKIEALSSGTTRKRISRKNLGNISTPIPPIEEQTRIVTAVESLQQRSAKARTLLTEVEPLIDKLRQSILQSAFSGRLTADWRTKNPNVEPADQLLVRIRAERRQRWEDAELAKFEAKGKTPNKGWQKNYVEPEHTDTTLKKHLVGKTKADIELMLVQECVKVKKSEIAQGYDTVRETTTKNWPIAKIGSLFTFIDYRGRNPKKSKSGHRLITAKNIRMGYMNDDPVEYISADTYKDWMTRGLPKYGDIFLVTEGHTMGFVALNRRNDDFALAQRTITLQPPSGIDPRCYFYFLMSNTIQKLIDLNATGSAARGIKAAKLRDISLPFPTYKEQAEIANRLDTIFIAIDRLKIQLLSMERSLEQFHKSTLSKAFRGELVPQDSNDEPASELLARIQAASEAEASAKKVSNKRNTRKKKKASP